MGYVVVYFKNENLLRQPLCIDHVEEHYCTEKMFFARSSNGTSTYINLDEICRIDVIEPSDLEKVEKTEGDAEEK